MTAQKRETAKNYIGLLSDDIEDLQAAEMRSAVIPRLRDHLLGLLATMFNRRSEAR